jgi:hypothetical protein
MRSNSLPVVLFCDRRDHELCPIGKKITFAEARESGVRGLLVYGADYRCSHSTAISGDEPDDVRLSDVEARFVCRACGKRGADLRPDFNWDRQPGATALRPR